MDFFLDRRGGSKTFSSRVAQAARSLGMGLALIIRAATAMSDPQPAAAPPAGADEAQPSAPAVTIKTTAERVATRQSGGRTTEQLLPADHIVPGDTIIYTIEVRNEGRQAVDGYAFTSRVPEHMAYVADSAVAPGADIRFSVDGGRSFAEADGLTVHGPDGKQRPALAEDYTAIRWVLRNRLKSGSMLLARYRAVLR